MYNIVGLAKQLNKLNLKKEKKKQTKTRIKNANNEVWHTDEPSSCLTH